ncbi:hypothetical protein QGX15_gp064 [Pseudomonas phage psageK4e]|uniref:Uncharacterized protein n=1 Tax=Pseudomonas phage psageK4e TaxID=2875723 RepID=A0AAE8XNA9_9CAUD|nr:hypothetical protein QGX15_gp064 [Pseudomonas phage psageK4e]UAW53631.1 hypothetical protein psageK4e_183 [Pseudomonas phage psageK4e]
MFFYVWFPSIRYAKMWADTCGYAVKLGKQDGMWYVGF